MSSPTVWLFDLDNTLHNAAHAAFKMVDRSMNEYIERELRVSAEEADRLRHDYWARYGATLLGLIRHHRIRPLHFLEQTHRLPGLEQRVHGHPHDLAALRRLSGVKFILTNAPRGYTVRVLRVLGIEHLFDGVIAIEDMRMFGHWRPKPDTRMFRRLAARLRTPPGRCVLVEDTLAHQKAARSVGFRTVWMQRWLRRGRHGPEVGVYLHRKPAYVCARITSVQQLPKRVRP
jgi:putative hydrolase of the HAD superfamily